MTIRELVLKNRSYRRFDEKEPLSEELLKELVDLARLSPSAANLQPLRYVLSADSRKNARIFPCLAWAGYLKDWPGPSEGERPSGYIVMLGDTTVTRNFGCDSGIAAQSVMLGAVERGLGGCMIASIKKESLRTVLNISDQYEILLVLALGRPCESVTIESLRSEGDIRYWRDENGGHHVPKRSLDDVIL